MCLLSCVGKQSSKSRLMVPINFLHVVQHPPTDQIQIHPFHIFRSTEQMFQKYHIYLQSLIPLILKLSIHYLLSSSGQAPPLVHHPVLKSTSQDRPSIHREEYDTRKGKVPERQKEVSWCRCMVPLCAQASPCLCTVPIQTPWPDLYLNIYCSPSPTKRQIYKFSTRRTPVTQTPWATMYPPATKSIVAQALPVAIETYCFEARWWRGVRILPRTKVKTRSLFA
jgi:hypothetical protein